MRKVWYRGSRAYRWRGRPQNRTTVQTAGCRCVLKGLVFDIPWKYFIRDTWTQIAKMLLQICVDACYILSHLVISCHILSWDHGANGFWGQPCSHPVRKTATGLAAAAVAQRALRSTNHCVAILYTPQTKEMPCPITESKCTSVPNVPNVLSKKI